MLLNTAKNIYLGDKQVNRVYLGSKLVWEYDGNLNNKILPSLQYELLFDNEDYKDTSGNDFPCYQNTTAFYAKSNFISGIKGWCLRMFTTGSSGSQYRAVTVNIADSSNVNLSLDLLNYFNHDFTVTLWFSRYNDGRIFEIFYYPDGATQEYIGLDYYRSNINIGSVGVNNGKSLTANTWYFAVISKTNSTFKAVIKDSDNNVVDTLIAANLNLTNITNVNLSSATTYDFRGRIDQFRMFNKILTDAEIQTIYNSDGGITTGTIISDMQKYTISELQQLTIKELEGK